jgi:hypothetical protein
MYHMWPNTTKWVTLRIWENGKSKKKNINADWHIFLHFISRSWTRMLWQKNVRSGLVRGPPPLSPPDGTSWSWSSSNMGGLVCDYLLDDAWNQHKLLIRNRQDGRLQLYTKHNNLRSVYSYSEQAKLSDHCYEHEGVDAINSRFNLLDMPISTTAPIDAKTPVWPIDGIAQWLTNQRSLLGHIQAKTVRRFLIGCRLLWA